MELVTTIDTGESILVECPTSYHTTTTEQYQNMIKAWTYGFTPEGMIQVFASLTGRRFDEFYNSTDGKLEKHILNATKFVYEEVLEDKEAYPLPEYFMGKLIPEDLGRLTLGQSMEIRNELQGKDGRTRLSFIVAVYMCPKTEGKFEKEKALELEKEILKMPIATVFPVGFFFLRQLIPYGQLPINFWRRIWYTIKSFGISVWNYPKPVTRMYLNRTQM